MNNSPKFDLSVLMTAVQDACMGDYDHEVEPVTVKMPSQPPVVPVAIVAPVVPSAEKKFSATPKPKEHRLLTLSAVRYILIGETRKRVTEECGRGQAALSAATFVLRLITAQAKTSAEYDEFVAPVFAHVCDAFASHNPKLANQPVAERTAEARRLASEWMEDAERKLAAPQKHARKTQKARPAEAPKAKAPPAPFKFTVEGIRSVVGLAGNPEAPARGILAKLSATSALYSANELENLRSEVKVTVQAALMKRGLELTDAERAATAILQPQKQEVCRPRPEPQKGAPVYKAPRREHATSHAAPPVDSEAITASAAEVFKRFEGKHTKLTHEQRLAKAAAFAADLKAGAMKPAVVASKKKEDKPKGNKKAERANHAAT